MKLKCVKYRPYGKNGVRGRSHMKNVHGRLEDRNLMKKDMIFECCVFICMLLTHLRVWCHDRLHLHTLAAH